MIKLRRLLKNFSNLTVKGSREVEITGLTANSKVVAPGNLFIAKRGGNYDGNDYVPEAIAAGAAAILTDIYDPSLKGVVQLIYPKIEEIESELAATYYQHPSQQLHTIAITGTNGKTTTAFLIRHLLETAGTPCGLIGSIEYIIGQQRYQATRTTPDVVTNHRLLGEMVRHGCQAAVMEVTSHALDQNRTANIDFDVAIFTNFTQDHLDYHGSMDAYLAAKKILFIGLSEEATAIVNGDDPNHQQLLEGCAAKVLTFGIDGDVDIRASELKMQESSTELQVTVNEKTIPFCIPSVGTFNVYNFLATVAVGITRNIPIEKMSEILSVAPPIPGRMERIPNKLGIHLYVDYAHTDDALKNVLVSLNKIKKKRVITVFGCGGNRDQDKRKKMGAVASTLSDYTIITSDNPRSEDPETICNAISEGFGSAAQYEIELDRHAAIKKAIAHAKQDDLILIAGKGHETHQILGGQIREFDDRKIAMQLCNA